MSSPAEVLVRREDLLPVGDCGDYYLIDNIRYYKTEGPTATRAAAMRFLSAAVRMEDDAAAKAKQEAKEWEREHAVPLARTMFNTFHNYSDNYREDTEEAVWRKNYDDGNFAVKKWVATATAVLKGRADATD